MKINKEKIIIVFAVALVLSTISASAQIFKGYVISGSIGLETYAINDIEKSLQNPNILGEDFDIKSTGASFSAEGYALVTEKILLGISLGTTILPKSETDLGNLKTTALFGTINGGYALIHNDGLLLYPYLGLGAAGFNLHLQSTSPLGIKFNNNQSIPEGETKTITASGLLVELGFGVKKSFGPLVLGANAGFNVTGTSNWKFQDDKEPPKGISQRSIPDIFLRLTIGFGKI